MKRKYKLRYWARYSNDYEISADSVEEAVAKLKEQVTYGDLGDVNDLEFVDHGIEVLDDEDECE